MQRSLDDLLSRATAASRAWTFAAGDVHKLYNRRNRGEWIDERAIAAAKIRRNQLGAEWELAEAAVAAAWPDRPRPVLRGFGWQGGKRDGRRYEGKHDDNE